MLVQYGNRAGNIRVQFVDGSIYTYHSAGRRNIERMKVLARSGKALSGFIWTHG